MAKNIKNLDTKWNNSIIQELFKQKYEMSGISSQLLPYLFFKKYKDNLENLSELKNIFEETTNYCCYNLIDFISSGFNNKLIINYMSSYFIDIKNSCDNCELSDGWELLDSAAIPAGYFISQTNPSSAIVLRNVQNKATIIVLKDNFNDEIRARIFSIMHILMPWYFDAPTEEEKKFFKYLTDGKTEKVEKIMNKFYDELNIREIYFSLTLNGYENCLREQKINNLISNLESCLSDLRYSERMAASYLEKYNSVNYELTQLQSSLKDDSNNIAKFFISHKSIDKIVKKENGIIYSIVDTIDFYDEDEFKALYNSDSYFYKGNEINDLLYEVFVNHKGKFLTRSEFLFNNLSSILPRQRGQLAINDEGELPHPHLYFYGCLGENREPINQALMNGNWDLAIEQTIGATKNINFSDRTVMNEFLRYLRNNKNLKCIIADNGERMSLNEFKKYIKGDIKDGETN